MSLLDKLTMRRYSTVSRGYSLISMLKPFGYALLLPSAAVGTRYKFDKARRWVPPAGTHIQNHIYCLILQAPPSRMYRRILLYAMSIWAVVRGGINAGFLDWRYPELYL